MPRQHAQEDHLQEPNLLSTSIAPAEYASHPCRYNQRDSSLSSQRTPRLCVAFGFRSALFIEMAVEPDSKYILCEAKDLYSLEIYICPTAEECKWKRGWIGKNFLQPIAQRKEPPAFPGSSGWVRPSVLPALTDRSVGCLPDGVRFSVGVVRLHDLQGSQDVTPTSVAILSMLADDAVASLSGEGCRYSGFMFRWRRFFLVLYRSRR